MSFSRYNLMAWPKWSDNDLNSEQWENSRASFTHFYNDSPIPLPSSLNVHSWKRPHEIQNFKPIICSSPKPMYPNLFTNNQHLLSSEFMRWFISSVTILSYYGQEGLEIHENSDFSWNFRDKPWHGSLHIYSLNKAGRGATHDPRINSSGRYIVRLFFMGDWRRIEIDDLIPVNSEGKSLLPHTENYQELWSILLAKAMLKIAALSWTSRYEVKDFNPISCLTGWSCISLNITHLSPNDRWELLMKYLPTAGECQYNNELKNQSLYLNKEENYLNKEEKMHRQKSSRDSGKNKNSSQKQIEKGKSKDLFSVMTLLYIPSNVNNDLVKVPDGIIPNYPAYVESSCDVKSNPTLIKPMESWKLHRWLPWAMRQGIIDPADYSIPTRRIFLLNPTNVALINEEKKWSLMWLDFNKLSDYPINIFFFFKLNYFKCSIDVTATATADVLPDELQHKDKREKLNSVSRTKTKKLKEKELDDDTTNVQVKKYYKYNHIEIQSRNEPLYLFIDSVHSKFLLFDFSTLSQPDKNSSLIIERHCWFKRSLPQMENNNNKPFLEIKTTATKSKVLYLESGRYLLRIFCQSTNVYHLTISSDTNFSIGNRKEMYTIMQSESERIKILASKILNSMTDAINSFGSLNYRDNLKKYYHSYMPEKKNCGLDKSYKLIHKNFNEELIELIKKKCSGKVADILEALRIFFIDPQLGRNSKSYDDNNTSNSPVLNPSMEDIDGGDKNKEFESGGEEIEQNDHYNRIITNAATIIQSLWRMMQINLYKKIHDVNHKRHKSIKQILHYTLTNIIDLNAVCNLVRNFIKHDKLYLYPCSDDFQQVLEVQEITGNLQLISSHREWIPIVRLNFNVPNGSIVFACLDLFIDLPAYILQVFNNDTGCELQRIVNNVIPFHYQRNTNGYTVIGHGWSDDSQTVQQKQLKWSLYITTVKGDAQLIFFNQDKSLSSPIEIPALQIHELSNIYIPNVHNILFKAILKISDDNCWLSTLRVHTTFKKVKMTLRIINKNGGVATKVSGGSSIIIPIVYLKEDNEWLIEASLSPNSWPLTAEEWNIVAEAKKTTDHQLKIKEKSRVSKVKIAKNRQSKYLFQTPRWFLQVVSDAGEHLELYQDTSRDIEIRQIKESWKHDPDRINHGKELRENFLQKNCNLHEVSHESEEFFHDENRSLNPPQLRKIPSLNLHTLFVDNKNESRRLRTKSDEVMERQEREEIIIKFEEAQFNFTEHSSSLVNELKLNVTLSTRIPTKRNI